MHIKKQQGIIMTHEAMNVAQKNECFCPDALFIPPAKAKPSTYEVDENKMRDEVIIVIITIKFDVGKIIIIQAYV